MNKKPVRPPFVLLIIGAALIVIGQLLNPVGGVFIPKETLETDIFLLGVPFLTIFIAILLAFIFFIATLAQILNYKVSRRVYGIVETAILTGIALGIIGMFQPWVLAAYSYGFTVLLVSTLAFIVWSHIVPQGVHHKSDLGAVSVSEFESKAKDAP